MQITLFGSIWIVLTILLMFSKYKYMLTLMLFSCIFQASAVILVGDLAVSPWVFTSVFFIAKCIRSEFDREEKTVPIKWIIIFLIAYIVITLVALIVFDGMKIPGEYRRNIDWTVVTAIQRPLELTTRHITEFIIYLLFTLDFICMARVKERIEIEYVLRIINIIFIFVLIIGAIQYVITSLGLPSDVIERLIYSDISKDAIAIRREGYDTKIFSVFAEPSYCGAFIASMMWLSLVLNKGKIRLIHCIAFLFIVLSGSSTAYGTFAVGAIIYLLVMRDTKKLIQLSIAAVLAYIILKHFGIMDQILGAVRNKGDSISGLERGKWNEEAIKIFIKSYGWGVGMSSVRASSLAIGLLAQIGVIGTLLFVMAMGSLIIKGLYKKASVYEKAGCVGLLCVLAAQVIACPDLTFTVLWFMIFLVCLLNRYQNNIK